jgi:hypothetical protein
MVETERCPIRDQSACVLAAELGGGIRSVTNDRDFGNMPGRCFGSSLSGAARSMVARLLGRVGVWHDSCCPDDN